MSACTGSKPNAIGPAISFNDLQNVEWRFVPIKDIVMNGKVIGANSIASLSFIDILSGSITMNFAPTELRCL